MAPSSNDSRGTLLMLPCKPVPPTNSSMKHVVFHCSVNSLCCSEDNDSNSSMLRASCDVNNERVIFPTEGLSIPIGCISAITSCGKPLSKSGETVPRRYSFPKISPAMRKRSKNGKSSLPSKLTRQKTRDKGNHSREHLTYNMECGRIAVNSRIREIDAKGSELNLVAKLSGLDVESDRPLKKRNRFFIEQALHKLIF